MKFQKKIVGVYLQTLHAVVMNLYLLPQYCPQLNPANIALSPSYLSPSVLGAGLLFKYKCINTVDNFICDTDKCQTLNL